MPKVVHFEINCDDLKRASKFYADVFGWKAKNWDDSEEHLIIKTGENDEPGFDGGFMKRISPDATTINTIGVPSLDDFMGKVKEHGDEIITPRSTVPGVGYHAYCKDSEGNLFGIIELDQSAK